MKALALPTRRPFRELLSRMALLNDRIALVVESISDNARYTLPPKLPCSLAEVVGLLPVIPKTDPNTYSSQQNQYVLVHDKKPIFFFLRIFGALWYPTNDTKFLENESQVRHWVLLWLVPNSALAIPYVPPTNKDLELLFQLMFDEYFKTPTSDHPMPPVPAAPTLAIPIGPSVSISFDHDAPSSIIFAMQDEIHEFDRLDIWELVPPPDCAMIIALSDFIEVKHDEMVTVEKQGHVL
ncbi:hypothetical protein Tco_0464606 [Tanacetum coccineum]